MRATRLREIEESMVENKERRGRVNRFVSRRIDVPFASGTRCRMWRVSDTPIQERIC